MPIGKSIFSAARVVGGGAIGATIGGLASGSNTGTGQAIDAARGALIGTGAGLMTTGLGWRGAWAGLKGTLKGGLAVGGAGAVAGAKGGLGIGRFALRHPYAAAGLAGAGLAGYGLSRSGPQNANRSPAEMAQMSEMMGTPSTGFNWGEGSSRAAFEQSTDGLVQGLHRGRHRS